MMETPMRARDTVMEEGGAGKDYKKEKGERWRRQEQNLRRMTVQTRPNV